jgi:hypothetical protein
MKLTDYNTPDFSRNVAWGVADDGDIALRIQYIGTQDAADVEVNAAGLILFKHGAVGATVADTNVSADGTITTTGGTEDTVGEVLNIINATTNWRAIHVDALLADSLNNSLLDMGPSDAKVAGGLAIPWDSDSANWNISRLVAPDEIRDNIEVYYKVQGANVGAKTIDYDLPFRGTRGAVSYMAGVSTYASGTSTFQLISESPGNAAGVALSTSVIYADLTGATTVDAAAAGLDGSVGFEMSGKLGHRLVARINNSSVGASFSFRGNGRMYRSLS